MESKKSFNKPAASRFSFPFGCFFTIWTWFMLLAFEFLVGKCFYLEDKWQWQKRSSNVDGDKLNLNSQLLTFLDNLKVFMGKKSVWHWNVDEKEASWLQRFKSSRLRTEISHFHSKNKFNWTKKCSNVNKPLKMHGINNFKNWRLF